MNITIVGTGYVGLVSGTCFAETGNNVTCVDIDEEKIIKMKSGQVPIYEPGLETIFLRNIVQKRLKFTTSLEEGIQDSDIIFLALPTPPDEDGSADLKYVLKVAEDLSAIIKKYVVIVDKSTVPIGTADKVSEVLSAKLDPNLFDVVSNPEFLREGVAVQDFLKPERVVVGSDSEKARDIMYRLYEPFVRQGNPIIFMDVKSAEMTKYAANAFLATKITFMNEIANLCEKVGADVDNVRRGIGTDSRIGKRFLFPGVGYGGSCFPKDVQALHKIAIDNDYNFKVLRAVMDINASQKLRVADAIIEYFDGDLGGKRIAIWGLSFKPNTDDIREAPSLFTIEKLLDHGAEICAFDPEAMPNIRNHFGDMIELKEDMYSVLEDCDVLAIITEWNVFRAPDFNMIKERLNQPTIFDGRNLYDLEQMEELGFRYSSIGRRKIG